MGIGPSSSTRTTGAAASFATRRSTAYRRPGRVIHGAGFTLQLKRGLTVTGLVRDRDTHQPIPGMWVGRRGDPLNGLRSGEYSRVTDANGRFKITGLDSRLLDWKESFREFTAVAQPGLPYQTASVVVIVVMAASLSVGRMIARGREGRNCERIPQSLCLDNDIRVAEYDHGKTAAVLLRESQPNCHTSGLTNVMGITQN